MKAFELIAAGELGELMFTRSRYGHGGRLGYESEWRADFKKSGGGELIDQGPHLIDLNLQIFGELELKHGLATTFFWDMAVDDNAFLCSKTLLVNVPRYMFPALNGKICFQWKFMERQESLKYLDSEAVMGQSALPSIKCFPKWDHPRPQPGNFHGPTRLLH